MSTEPNTETEVEPNDTPKDPEEEAPTKGSNAEAAKYRKRLRETEAEVQRLTEANNTMRTAEVERLASAHLARPAALWAAGSVLDDLVDPEGRPDPAKIKAAAETAVEQLGLQPTRIGVVPTQGTGDTRPAAPVGLDAMADFIRDRRR